MRQFPRKQVVEADSLPAGLINVLESLGGRVLGTITESDHRALCTGWIDDQLYLVLADTARPGPRGGDPPVQSGTMPSRT